MPTFRKRKAKLIILHLLFTSLFLVNCSRSEERKDPSVLDQPRGNEAVDLPMGTDQPNSDVLQTAISTSADAIFNGINLRRVQEGFTPWVMDPVLVDLAYERAVDMAVRDYLDHVAPGESQVHIETRLRERGYSGQVTELIFGTDLMLEEVASQTLEAWFDDEDHQAVLLSPDLRFAGVGIMGDGERWIVTLICAQTSP